MITYNENADLSIIIDTDRLKNRKKSKSFARSKTEIAAELDRSKDSKWYKSLPNRKIK